MGVGTLDFRVFQEGDEAAILRLLKETTGDLPSLDEWAWLFPPEEDRRAIVVGERDDDVVAVCAGSPLRFAVEGRELAAVEIRKLAARDRSDRDRALEFFAASFASTDRFTLAMASFDFDSATQKPLTELMRETTRSVMPRRFLYRAEPARDWEPRLDSLWERVRGWYPAAVVRDADLALRRFAGHPSIKHHRFLVFPRYSRSPVAFAVFADDGSNCCWLDLIWDHEHRGALDLLAHISCRLVAQWGSSGERLWLAGDEVASKLLEGRGFRPQTSTPPVASMGFFNPDLDAKDMVGRAYLTLADVGGLGP